MKSKINKSLKKDQQKINQEKKDQQKINQEKKDQQKIDQEKINQEKIKNQKLQSGIGSQEAEKIIPSGVVEKVKTETPVVTEVIEDSDKKIRKERVDKGKKRGRSKKEKERFEIPFSIAILGLSKLGSLLTKDKKWLTTEEEADDFEQAINETLSDVLPEDIKLSKGVAHLMMVTGKYFIDRF